MFNLLAGAFMSIASLFGFGGHASTTPSHMGSTSPMHMASSTRPWDGRMGSTTPMNGTMPGIMGTVSSITGTTLTVEGKDGMQSATTTYTVDASGAKVMKAGTSSTTVSDIVSGDHVTVVGTVNGTTVIAKLILDGAMHMMRGDMHPGNGMNMGSTTHSHPMIPAK